MKNRPTGTAETPEELVENLRSLIAEAEKTLGEKLSEEGQGRLNELYARLEAARDKLEDIYGRAREKVVAGARTADDTIRSHPYQSLAIALGIGVLLGALIRGGSRD